MGKLNGKIALIAGGTGGVGEGIVRSHRDEGATVVIPSRSAENHRTVARISGRARTAIALSQ